MVKNSENLTHIQDHTTLRRFLDALRQKLDRTRLIRNDPVLFVHKFNDKKNKEIAGFLASHFAFGRVNMIIKNLEGLFNTMQWKPYDFVMEFNHNSAGLFSHYVYRFVRGNHIVSFIYSLKELYSEYGGLEDLFLRGYSEDDDNLLNAIYKFVEHFYSLKALKNILQKSNKDNSGLYFLIPPPGSKSAYKRLNLFLRWMVRYEEGLDTGLWKRIKPSQLIIPLDTHIARISRNIGLTRRRTPDIKMAIEITENLKSLDRDDPLKYDFALCHIGISEGCRGKYNGNICTSCRLYDMCVLLK